MVTPRRPGARPAWLVLITVLVLSGTAHAAVTPG